MKKARDGSVALVAFGGNVKHVNGACAERFRVRRAERLRFGEHFRPGDGRFDQCAGLCIGFDGLQQDAAFVCRYVLAKDSGPQGVAEFMPLQWSEDQGTR